MNLHRTLLPLITLFSLSGCGSATVAESIANAHYTNPVERYSHFALGKPHEYATLIATTLSGRTLTLQLPDDEVFEDLMPRLVKLAAKEPQAILAIVSQADSGARLVLIQPQDGILAISAQSPAIGMPNRWLNPVAVADLDGDGRAEISAVITPHIGGTLKIYRKNGKRLIEVASLGGFSNHAYGTPELNLSTSFSVSGRTYLLVPDTTRQQLRIIALENDRLVEAGHCALPAPITGPIKVISALEVSVVTLGGIHTIAPSRCLKQAVYLA
ncbi:MAG: VCBS repeat-containing protein [Sulfuriferula multivorans]|uniref:VCBS repeat-containing protein n=1 Tax=Sulfuriferula multivorans TaxID=1559896 RepID=A0A7C9P8S8_9PROT|nr:VCBS repeat-containing protein [Sulfuriferula multivorans]